MTEVRRTNLEWARDIARAYRAALRAVAPEKCAELDELARKRGQRWVAPTLIPTPSVEESMEAVLPPKVIEEFWGYPARTLYGWSSKGLLTNLGKPGAPLFKVADVLACESRSRRNKRQRGSAA